MSFNCWCSTTVCKYNLHVQKGEYICFGNGIMAHGPIEERDIKQGGYKLKGNEKLNKNNILSFEDIISLGNKMKGELDMDFTYINMTSLYVLALILYCKANLFFHGNALFLITCFLGYSKLCPLQFVYLGVISYVFKYHHILRKFN